MATATTTACKLPIIFRFGSASYKFWWVFIWGFLGPGGNSTCVSDHHRNMCYRTRCVHAHVTIIASFDFRRQMLLKAKLKLFMSFTELKLASAMLNQLNTFQDYFNFDVKRCVFKGICKRMRPFPVFKTTISLGGGGCVYYLRQPRTRF